MRSDSEQDRRQFSEYFAARHDAVRPRRAEGRIWVRGKRPRHRAAGRGGQRGRRTWSVQVFADAPAYHPEGCRPAELATGGPYAYALAVGESARAVYRFTRDGGWQRVSGVDRVPAERLETHASSFVAGDGTHVLCETVSQPDGRDGCRFWAGRDGTYQPVEVSGLPATVYAIRRTPDGWFLTYSYTDRRLFGSTDGWTWSALSAR